MLLLTRLIASFDEADHSQLDALLAAGLTPELVERLRTLTLFDALRLTGGQGGHEGQGGPGWPVGPGRSVGLSIALDVPALQHQLLSLDRLKADRLAYEAFVKAGASAGLLARLFGVRPAEARLHRKYLAPEVTLGGRPRTPPDALVADILQAWNSARAGLALGETPGNGRNERARYWATYESLGGQVSLSQIENTVRGAAGTGTVDMPATRRRR